ncbi:MAG: NAD-dependent epimerase/dehydratase family protein, partial [Verrucomicrobiales bacterium]|nr:NAD-dependent epimerase/dehydratase family protein [Verrucomicrobiales bacterium]
MSPAPKSLSELDDRASEPDELVCNAVAKVNGPVVVAGAGGKMGFHLCRMLRRALDQNGQNTEVIAVSRFGNPSTREPFEEHGIQTLSADLTGQEGVDALPEAGAVFFLAGQKFGTGDSPEILRLFNEEMPAKVAERYAGTPIVALSTGCVYPFVSPESGGSREADRIGPNGDYALSCVGRENAFLAFSKVHQSPIALIRLNYSVDLRYGVLVDIASRVYRAEPVDVTMGYLNCLWQGDAIRYTILALDHAFPAPQPFVLNVTGAEILAVRDLAHRFG